MNSRQFKIGGCIDQLVQRIANLQYFCAREQHRCRGMSYEAKSCLKHPADLRVHRRILARQCVPLEYEQSRHAVRILHHDLCLPPWITYCLQTSAGLHLAIPDQPAPIVRPAACGIRGSGFGPTFQELLQDFRKYGKTPRLQLALR